jgi:agmatinase
MAAKKDKVPDNFCGLAKEFSNYSKSKIVILPVPFDKTASWLKGSDKGPRALIEASKNMEVYDIETNTEIYKKGIYTEKPIIAKNSVSMINQVYKKARNLLKDKKFVVTVGGEHSISTAPIRAHSEFFPDMSVLHLDAHSDRRNSYEGNKYSHASVIARVNEVTDRVVSVGIRSMDSSELESIRKNKVFYSHEIFKTKNWIAEIVKSLTKNVYITLDLDVFDPSIMPSTGTPEPGGLTWQQVTGLLREVASRKNIVGADIVELCPSGNKAPDFLAAKLVYKMLSYKFA